MRHAVGHGVEQGVGQGVGQDTEAVSGDKSGAR